MPQRFTCPRGHHWRLSVEGHSLEGLPWLLCPVCGSRPVSDPDATPEPTPPAASTNPALLAGYEILGELGRGDWGIAYYKARSRGLDRLVALKMLVNGGPPERAYLRREAEVLARLQHPNVIQVYEVGEHDGRPFLAIELVEGDSLKQKTAGEPQPPRAAAELVEVLARAVHYVHQQGFIHRNLKPADILLAPGPGTAYGVPKIADFGLVKRLPPGAGPEEAEGTVAGTPAYMAPEQAAGRPRDIGPATDVYGLGTVLYELLTGRPPFQADSLANLLQQVMSHEPVAPSRLQPKVPRDLEAITLKCLAKQPPKRYARALDLADDLRRFLEDRPLQARPMSPGERLWRWCRRNPTIAMLAAAGIVCSLAVAASSVSFAYQAVERQRRLEAALRDAEQARREADEQRQRAEEALKVAGEPRQQEKP
jgi:eukaryotic-like serine/threonine-protein kinase